MSVFSYVQSASGVVSTTNAFGTANTAGNIIIAVHAGFQSTLATAISDTRGNTYTLVDFSNTENNRIITYVATNIAAGTNTLTFSGASTSNDSFILAEYAVPSAYIFGTIPKLPQSNRTTSVINMPTFAVGTTALPAEVMIIPIYSDQSSFHTWTLSTGTVRETTHEGGGATAFLGDFDVVSPAGVVLTTASGSSGAWISASMYLMTLSAGTGTGGGVIFGDMAGGMRG